MSTLLPPDLHEMLFADIKSAVKPRPYSTNAKANMYFGPKHISLLMLCTKTDTPKCNAFFRAWVDGGKNISDQDRREEFCRGMVTSARADVIAFLQEHIFGVGTHSDVGALDIAEATTIELVVTIVGNLIMRDIQDARAEQDDDPEARR